MYADDAQSSRLHICVISTIIVNENSQKTTLISAPITRAHRSIDHVGADDNDCSYYSDKEVSNYFVIPISALKVIILKALSWYFAPKFQKFL